MSATRHDLVVVGASAGGVDALVRLVSGLPSDLPAAILVVLHLNPDTDSNLAAILERAGTLPVRQAADGMAIEPGLILCAPPDRHVAVRGGTVVVSRGPRVNMHRPSVDLLFRSAAVERGAGVCGIVLSGALDDGATGMRAIRRAGGITIVQEPGDALVPGMPGSVLAAFTPDHVLTAEAIGRQLAGILDGAGEREAPRRSHSVNGSEAAVRMSEPGASDGKPAGAPSQFGCPDCGGVLWLADEDDLRFECRIGHAYTATSLAAAEDGRLEDALWAAVRMLEEQESLARRLIERQDGHDSDGTIHRLEHRLTRARERADVLRDFLLEPSNDRAGAILSGRTSAKLNRSATSV